MARRGHTEEELPFVALMDTMTNVVGVLIIVLVMIGIGLARSVNKVLSELPPVTVEEHAELKKKIEEVTPKKDPKEVEEELKKLTEQTKKVTEELKTLDVVQEKQVKMMDLDDLQKQLEARRKERDQKKTEVEKMLADVDKLKKQLDTTPVYVPPPAVVVKLPNPRPMPDKAELQRFLVMGGRIIYLNEEALAGLAEQELKRGETTLAISREVVKGPDGKPVMVKDKAGRPQQQRKVVFDPKKVSDYFSRARLGTREMQVTIVPSATSPRIPVRLTPVPNTGETLDQIKSLISQYQTLLKKFKTDPKAVVWFMVFKDSIPTYLQAREYADQMGIPVGWELTGNPFFQHYLPPEYAVTFTPPPPPPAGAQPAVTIAAPKTGVD